MLYTVEGIVIRSMDYGEGNKIITLYTKEWGKVSVMARGAKKMRSRFAAMTQLFTFGEFTYYSSGQMGNLSGGEIIKSFQSLQADLHKTAYAAYILEMIDRMLLDHDGSSYLFGQLLAALDAIEEGKDPQVIAHLFELKVLSFGGYAPVLQSCAVCSEPFEHPMFSAQLGGMLCAACLSKDTTALRLSERTLKLLQIFQDVDLRRLGKIDVSEDSKAELKRCMRLFMDIHVSGYWKSRHFLDQMDKHELL